MLHEHFKLLDWVTKVNHNESLPSLLRLNFGCTLIEAGQIVEKWEKKNDHTQHN